MNDFHPLAPAGPPLRAIPPLTALLAFERAAAQLSFRRAARDLALSPSAISHQIRGLEEQFGVKLFVRGARSVRLTADGERYFARISVALAALQDAGREMLRHRRDSGGELWISSLPFFTSTVLLPALADFKRRHPALTLRIEVAGRTLLLAGDLEATAEAALIARGAPLRAELLKLSHHGSRTSSSAVFLDAVGGSVAVASAPRWSRFGMPHPDVADRVRGAGYALWWTGRDGAVLVGLAPRLWVRGWRDWR